MPMIYAILALAVIEVIGIGIVAFFGYRTVKIQQQMIGNIAMFKKVSDPWQLNVMNAAMKATATEEKEDVQVDPNDQPSVPSNPSDEAMDKIRASI